MARPIEVDDVMAANAAYWADKAQLLVDGETFGFSRFEYQIEPLSHTPRKQVVKKGTQGGWTLMEILRAFHGLRYKRYPKGVLYMFPTGDDVGEFSRSRWTPLLSDNHQQIGQHVYSTDAASLKRIGQGFLYLRGARLSQEIAGSGVKESTKLRSIPVDRAVFDEFDLMSDDVVEKARGRMGQSDRQEECYLSNPTIPGHGIDALYEQSDQRQRMIKCRECGHWTCPEADFPKCVRTHEDGTGYLACIHCGREIYLVDGTWEAQYPSRSSDLVGYWWSWLQNPKRDPAKIIKALNDPHKLNKGDVYRLQLGRAYIESEHQLTKQDVYTCCGQRPMSTEELGPCAMGVDVGKVLHVVAGKKVSENKHELVYASRIAEFADLTGIIGRFNIEFVVIDLDPETHMVREWQRYINSRPRGKCRVMACRYVDQQRSEEKQDDMAGITVVPRTELCDRTHNLIASQRIEIPGRCNEVDQFAQELVNTAKVLQKNKRTGIEVYRYVTLMNRPDHYYHALGYYLLAASHIGVAHEDLRSYVLRGGASSVAEEEDAWSYDVFGGLKGH
jgi:hypothetical protein